MILGLALSVLVVGTAVAGPTRSDGDPDRPQIAQPGGPGYQSASRANTHRHFEAATEMQAQAASEHWKAVLRVYLTVIRVFAL
jgi:hypothetical protein